VGVNCFFFFFQAEDGIRDWSVTGVQTCALPISSSPRRLRPEQREGPLSAPPRRRRGDEGRLPGVDQRPLPARARDAVRTARPHRSEERRVGKEGRSRWAGCGWKEKTPTRRFDEW